MRVFHAPEDIADDAKMLQDADGWVAARHKDGVSWRWVRDMDGRLFPYDPEKRGWQWREDDAFPVTEVES